MAVDRALIGNFAMEAIDAIVGHMDEDHVEVKDMMLIVALEVENGDGTFSNVLSHCSDDRFYVQRGLIEGARDASKGGYGNRS